MNFTTTLTYIACICFIFIIGRLFILPLKFVFKLIINSLLGGLLIFLINLFCQSINFHIGLNLFTSIFVGILGIPRCNDFNTNTSFSDIKTFHKKSGKRNRPNFQFPKTFHKKSGNRNRPNFQFPQFPPLKFIQLLQT